ncbi:TPO protein, partial [Asarcornis scutulata]|nr:TPO protein [Asarcornis scutulata]
SPPGLLLLTSFLLHVKEGRASPARLVCDSRLIHKYIGEAKDMEKKANQCQAPSALSCPVALPPVDVKMTQWKTKSVRRAGRMVLGPLGGGGGGGRPRGAGGGGGGGGPPPPPPPPALWGQQGAEHGDVCDPSVPFSPPQEEPWEPGCSAGSKELNTAVIFLAYQRLLQGKLRFFFHDLAKDLCD